jgi:hypothetical protein
VIRHYKVFTSGAAADRITDSVAAPTAKRETKVRSYNLIVVHYNVARDNLSMLLALATEAMLKQQLLNRCIS